MLFLILFLSCFDKSSLKKGFDRVDTIFLEVKDREGFKLDADVKLISSNSYSPYYSDDGFYFFNVPDAAYTVFVEKEGFEKSVSTLLVMHDGDTYVKGNRVVVLNRKKVLEKKLPLLGTSSLELISDTKTFRFKAKDNCISITEEHFGTFYNGGDRVDIFESEGEIVVENNHKRVNHLSGKGKKCKIHVKLSPSILDYLRKDLIDVEVDFLVPDKYKYDIIGSGFDISDDGLEISVCCDPNASNFKAEMSLRIGEFESIEKVNLENANLKFRLDTRYSITKLEMPFEPKRLNFNILSSNSVKFYCKGSCLLIHALGDSSISIASPSFEQIRLLPEQLGSTLEVELHAKAINFSIHVTSRIKSRIIMNLGSSDELYLLKKDFTNDYHVLSKLDSANPFFFPSEIIGYIDKFYGLLIERDSKERITNQRLFFLKDKQASKPSCIHHLTISSLYNGMISLNGLIFVDLNKKKLDNCFDVVKSFIPNIYEFVIRFKVKGPYQKDTFKSLPGADITFHPVKGLLFNPDSAISKFGDKIALDLFRCCKDYSKIDKDRTILIEIFAVSTLGKVKLDNEMPVIDDRGDKVDLARINVANRVNHCVFAYSDLVRPIFSSQTFNMKMSYSEKDKLLPIGSYYENFVRNSCGDNSIVVSVNNVLKNGDIGQNFHQLINLEIDRKQRELGRSIALGGAANLMQAAGWIQTVVSLFGLFFGTKSYIHSSNSVKDSSNWDENFIDSKGCSFNGIRNSSQQNYAIEWSMYVCTQGMDSIIMKSPVIYGSPKIKVHRVLQSTLDRKSYKFTHSNFGHNTKEEEIRLIGDWHHFTIRVDKVGKSSDDWGVNIPMPFKVFRHTSEILTSVDQGLLYNTNSF